MRRSSSKVQKGKKSAHDDTDEAVVMDDSVKADNGGEVETLSSAKKRTSRGNAKDNEDKNGSEKQGNRKSLNKRKSDSNGSELEVEKPAEKKKKGKSEVGNDESHDDESEKVKGNGKSPSKSKKKGNASKKEEDESDDGEEYEVEKIVDQRTIKGMRQFLIRWKGYSADADTWEQETKLNCDRLIEEFLAEQEENEKSAVKETKEKGKPESAKKAKSKKPARRSMK
ncbi:M-phase phosphoprotein 8-like [Copidosoma floridanum]|uniref:M-phase phosphoprotein 8-like n=1 Tax=Copidosoma floridanum TaxID=29053 RepID=UPI0006C94A7B|nr:M-phase phosphoprotein 8-like [Copidosoma floridanum]